MFVDTNCYFRMPSGHEKFTSIADLGGWGYTNSDIRGYLASLTILQVRSLDLSQLILLEARRKCMLIDYRCYVLEIVGLLPREARQVAYHQCSLHIHECMENGLPIY